MYPLNHFNLFPAFPTSNKVFVITAFDKRLDERFTKVIAPAIGRVQINGTSLVTFRVNQSTIGDSILIEILREIQTARLVFADVTSLDQLNGRPIRNPNALYELGIAHATRLPEEVLVFRSDELPLSFDISPIRVRQFAPETDPKQSIQILSDAILDALRTLDLTRQLAVKRAVSTLDHMSQVLLLKAHHEGGLEADSNYSIATMGHKLMEQVVTNRLLEAGLLTVEYKTITEDMVDPNQTNWKDHKYVTTPLGLAVISSLTHNRFTPDALAKMDAIYGASARKDNSSKAD